jgi:hypothetical protein
MRIKHDINFVLKYKRDINYTKIEILSKIKCAYEKYYTKIEEYVHKLL